MTAAYLPDRTLDADLPTRSGPTLAAVSTVRARKIAFIGNSLPRLCGIATFTNDLERSVGSSRAGLETGIVAMSEPGQTYEFPGSVHLSIREDRIGDYRAAAAALNAGGYDAVSLQHEFGIFGGEAGGDVISILSALEMPIVTTLHTVLARPTAAQREVIRRVVEVSAKVVVMAEKGRDLLETVYRAAPDKIEVIPHGVPDFPFVEPAAAKARHGLAGRDVILTFGLLAPSKGIDVMIEAMPEVLTHRPNAIYLILGATHPNLKRRHGEAYRESLKARVEALGLGASVIFLDQFVDQPTLLEFISLCDVYVTPYRNEAQLTSGTLAYSFGLGKAIVSTPYWHAAELLADGQGVLAPMNDSAAFGREVSALLVDGPRRDAMRRRAYANSRGMTWARTGSRYLEVIDKAVAAASLRPPAPPRPAPETRALPRPLSRLPDVRTAALEAMCDDVGIIQHAVFAVADRHHGYCVDDNARALLLACRLARSGEALLSEALAGRFAAFVQHAWNPDTERFRNFMGFDRRWLEDQGSEDSHARTLWALGECARFDLSANRRRWATALFQRALPPMEVFVSPRSWAFALLGLDAYLGAAPDDWSAALMRERLAAQLLAQWARHKTAAWPWFEPVLAYDNARLPEALIRTGVALAAPETVQAGLRALTWLAEAQTTPEGLFRPIGTDSFQRPMEAPLPFDQQPLEAAASISAYLAAAGAEPGNGAWRPRASAAFAWFLGANDLSTALADPDTGGCRDGLHPDRANENQGAESILAYLLGLVEMRESARRVRAGRPSPQSSIVGA